MIVMVTSPDIDRMTQYLNTEIIGSIGELATSKEVESLRQEVRKTIAKWTLPDYKQRELARRELMVLLQNTKGMVGIEQILREELTPKRSGKSWIGNWDDLEVRTSAKVVLNAADQISAIETLYPPLNSTVGQVLSDMRKFGGANIRLVGQDSDAINQLPLLSNVQMTHSQLLARICEITGTYPVSDGHPHTLKLVPQEKSIHTLTALQGALLVTEQTEENENRTVHLLTDPQFAVVNAEEGTLNDGNNSATQITFAESSMPGWEFTSGKSELAKLSLPSKGTVSPQNLRIKGWIGSEPASCTLPVGDEKQFGNIGPQEVSVMLAAKETITCSNTVYGYLPWPKTPCPSDMQSYALAHATRFTFLSKKGETIQTKTGPATVNQRVINWDTSGTEKPEKVEIRGFQDLRQEEIIWDLQTGKMSRKILKHCIDVN